MRLVDFLEKLNIENQLKPDCEAEILKADFHKGERALYISLDYKTEEIDKAPLEAVLSKTLDCQCHLTNAEKENRLNSFYGESVAVDISFKEKKAKSSKKCESTFDENGIQIGKFRKKELNILSLDELSQSNSYVACQGILGAKVKDENLIVTKKGSTIFSFFINDRKGMAISCKMFVDEDQSDKIKDLKKGDFLYLEGSYKYDDFAKRDIFQVRGLKTGQETVKGDSAKVKRVELGVHTQMSNMMGLIDPKDLKKRLTEWGHEAFGFCDYGSLQAYPIIQGLFEKSDIKAIYGYHAKVLDDDHKILQNPYKKELKDLEGKYTVFDIETTGFSRFNDAIIEIGAVRIENGSKVGEFSEFVNPKRLIPARITELTSITDAMVMSAPPIEEILPKFLEFSKDTILVAHNADFDIGFIKENAYRQGLEFHDISIDSLGLARMLHPEYKNHKLDTISKNLGVPSFHHHRAIDDAKATADAFQKLMGEFYELGIGLENINSVKSDFPMSRHESYELLVYVEKQEGLKNFYDLVSRANMEFYWKSPGLPESILYDNRKGLKLATGFVGSKLFDRISKRRPMSQLLEIAQEADFLVVQPPEFAEKAINEELVADYDHYKEIVKEIIDIADRLGMPCCVIGMPTYLDDGERRARNIVTNYQRKLDFDFNERERLRNTDEMLEAFSFLGPDKAYEIVVENTVKISKAFESIRAIPDGTFTPNIEGAQEKLTNITETRARELYGDPLPEIVEKRLEKELGSIISNGYSSLYVIAKLLVDKSNSDGYLVGSRGSVGSSFVAYLAGITEVNPLSPHYVCPNCKHSEFIDDPEIGSGFDLEEKPCPECGSNMRRDGHRIPFEVFLGFHGDKEPDIDLNFAGEYMPVIHKYTETLFGQGKVFRAGTISAIKEKTAYGYIRKYLEQEYIPDEDMYISPAQIDLIKEQMEGTKRTTGQHAGGLMIVPAEMDISDFCPVQFPADDVKSDVVTTHFSYENLSGRMLKLDELGQTTPSIIKQLQDLTGIDPLDISFDDHDTMSIFRNTEKLDIKSDYSNSDDGSLGIPEFGTDFVRSMLKDTKPSTFAELVRISGLSHGTDVWVNNAQDLVRSGVIDLKRAICTRDDIMTYLLSKGMDELESFKTMESVRKGRGIPEATIEHMKEHGVPDWYINSCLKIQYMFPKAHATAYVMMSYRIAWFKVHSPAAFYATYYTQRLSDFTSSFLFKDLESVSAAMEKMKLEDEDKKKITLLEVIEEMYARDYKFADVDLHKSQATMFTILDERTVLPPLAALDGVSEALANTIVEEREKGDFISRNDFKARTGANRSAMTSMGDSGLLDAYPVSNQMSFLTGF